MVEYIEREALKKSIREKANPEGCTHITPQDVYLAVLTVIEFEPAADVEEVRRSHWEIMDIGPDWVDTKCFKCGSEYAFTPERDFFDYCPACGAKMDKKEGETHEQT